MQCSVKSDSYNKTNYYEVCPKSNENDFKKHLLNMHAFTVYPLQNRLLVIEYSDSNVAATRHSSGGSLHLRCCSKPSSQLPGRFQLSQNDVLWGGFWVWRIKKIARSHVRAVWWVWKRRDIILSQKFPNIGQILRDQFHTNFSHVQIFRADSVDVHFR